MEAVQETVRRISVEAEAWSAEELLCWGFERFGSGIAFASSFGAEDVVLIEIAANLQPKFRVFTLDTDFLFPETYELIERVERRYGIRVERVRSEYTAEEQSKKFGPALWSRDPDLCCRLRKVAPLKGKLAELQAWITGVRREQSPTRADARKLDWDANFHLAKLNPLADWTWAQVWEFIRARQVPYNPMHDQNYPSIGCTYCTRPVQPGQESRAGRWIGFAKTECGLHGKG